MCFLNVFTIEWKIIVDLREDQYSFDHYLNSLRWGNLSTIKIEIPRVAEKMAEFFKFYEFFRFFFFLLPSFFFPSFIFFIFKIFSWFLKKRRFFTFFSFFFFFFATENEVLGDSWAPPWKSTPNESLFGRWPTKRVVCIRGAAERMAAGHNPPINEGEARAAPTVFWKSTRQRGTAPSFLPPRMPYLHLNRIPRWGTMLYVYTILLWIRSIQPGQRHFPRINESPWILS